MLSCARYIPFDNPGDGGDEALPWPVRSFGMAVRARSTNEITRPRVYIYSLQQRPVRLLSFTGPNGRMNAEQKSTMTAAMKQSTPTAMPQLSELLMSKVAAVFS